MLATPAGSPDPALKDGHGFHPTGNPSNGERVFISVELIFVLCTNWAWYVRFSSEYIFRILFFSIFQLKEKCFIFWYNIKPSSEKRAGEIEKRQRFAFCVFLVMISIEIGNETFLQMTIENSFMVYSLVNIRNSIAAAL